MFMSNEFFSNFSHFSDMKFEMMTAQCLLFYVGGFDLSCKILSFLLFELARNPEIQSKAREDIISALHNTNGKLTYDVLRQLTYVKKVITGTHIMQQKERSIIYQLKKQNNIFSRNFTKIPTSNNAIS